MTALSDGPDINSIPSSPALPMIRSVQARNLLSFGPDAAPLELRSLNVLIGPNGSGKSNLLELFALARSSPSDIRTVLRKGGGVREWVWKGAPNEPAMIDVIVDNPRGAMPLRHHLSIGARGQAMQLIDERIENASPHPNNVDPYFYYRYQGGRPVLNKRENTGRRQLSREDLDPDTSILSQIRDPETFPELSWMAGCYRSIRLYREWGFGRNTVFREPQQADGRNDLLEEDFSNLGLILNRHRKTPNTRREILELLRDLYEGLDEFDISVEGGTVQVFLTEGDYAIPATRLSDGTLRYLCLLSILCDPTPPPVICIEEPELGLHPDLLPKVADLLVDASRRTQLLVTTHSDVIVDSLTSQPESIIVCEKHGGCSTMRRLDTSELAVWLETYRLGELWSRGQLGGNRW